MKLKRIILLLLTVMFSFSYGEVFAKDVNSLKKALKNKFLIGVSVNTHQSSGKDVAAVEIVKKNFDLRPGVIFRDLDLKKPIYQRTAAYGHFGRDSFPWEVPKKLKY